MSRVSLGLVDLRRTHPQAMAIEISVVSRDMVGLTALRGRKVKVEVGQVGYYEGAPGSHLL